MPTTPGNRSPSEKVRFFHRFLSRIPPVCPASPSHPPVRHGHCFSGLRQRRPARHSSHRAAREVYALFHNDGDGSFSYRSLQAGLGVLSAASSGWGVGLEDFDNDGWKDLFVAQSHVLDNVEQIDHMLHYKEQPLLALNRNGRFERAESGVAAAIAGRGAAFGDLNSDGFMDVVVTSLGGEPLVLLNHRGGAGNWLSITLRGTRSNRDGIGAAVAVNGQKRFATTAGSYVSASDKRLHFGLGTTQVAKVEIHWPSGIHQTLEGVKANQFLEVREPEKP